MLSALVLFISSIQATPTYGEHIAPLFARSCMPCHAPGGVGPFRLDRYQDVSRRLELIRTVTLSKQMPPHRATSDFGAMVPVPPLSDEELVLLQGWVRTGAKEGASRPTSSETSTSLSTDQTFRVRAPQVIEEGEPYWVKFTVPIGSKAIRFGGLRITPETPTAMRRVDLATGRRITAVNSVRSNGDFADSERPILTWSAGYDAIRVPGHITLEAGSVLVIQVLYTPIGRSVSGDFTLEILNGGEQPFEPTVISEREFVVPSMKVGKLSRTLVLEKDQVIGGVMAFGRKFAAEVKIEAEIPNEITKSVLYLQHFNYLWVGSYLFSQPVRLSKGTKIVFTSTYDNTEHCSANVGRTIKPVRLGPGYDDEMYKFSLLMGYPNER